MPAMQTKSHQQCWLDSITNMEVPAKNTKNRHAAIRNNSSQIKPNGRVGVRFSSEEFSWTNVLVIEPGLYVWSKAQKVIMCLNVGYTNYRFYTIVRSLTVETFQSWRKCQTCGARNPLF